MTIPSLISFQNNKTGNGNIEMVTARQKTNMSMIQSVVSIISKKLKYQIYGWLHFNLTASL